MIYDLAREDMRRFGDRQVQVRIRWRNSLRVAQESDKCFRRNVIKGVATATVGKLVCTLPCQFGK